MATAKAKTPAMEPDPMLVELEADVLALGEAVDVWVPVAVPVSEEPDDCGAPVSVPVAVGEPEEAVAVLLPGPVVVLFPTSRVSRRQVKT